MTLTLSQARANYDMAWRARCIATEGKPNSRRSPATAKYLQARMNDLLAAQIAEGEQTEMELAA